MVFVIFQLVSIQLLFDNTKAQNNSSNSKLIIAHGVHGKVDLITVDSFDC